MSLTCKGMYLVCNNDAIWRRLSIGAWGNMPKENELSWKNHFIELTRMLKLLVKSSNIKIAVKQLHEKYVIQVPQAYLLRNIIKPDDNASLGFFLLKKGLSGLNLKELGEYYADIRNVQVYEAMMKWLDMEGSPFYDCLW